MIEQRFSKRERKNERKDSKERDFNLDEYISLSDGI